MELNMHTVDTHFLLQVNPEKSSKENSLEKKFSGIFEIAPRDDIELGEQFKFRQSITIGTTDFTEQEVRRIIEELGNQFRGDKYHLMNNNCNHFSQAVTQVTKCKI